jgi:hypothetical protein
MMLRFFKVLVAGVVYLLITLKRIFALTDNFQGAVQQLCVAS